MTTQNLPPRTPGRNLRPIEESDLARYGSQYDFDSDDLDLEYEEYGLGLGDRVRNLMARVLMRVGWLVLAAGLGFGSAGIVAATNHLPANGERPELTWAADNQLSTRLDAAVRDLARLKDDVDSLGEMARKTLAALAQVNRTDLQAAYDGGWNNVNSIDAGAADLKNQLQCDQWGATLQADLVKQYSSAMVDRYHGVCLAIDSVSPLHDEWQSMVDSSATAIRVIDDVETHDSTAGDALQSATLGRYPDALTQLTRADDSLADASTIATTLAVTNDVSTLTTWLARTQAVDDALSLLWQSMIDSTAR